MEQYTTLVQQTIADAQQIAQTRHHQAIDIAHVWRVLMQSCLLYTSDAADDIALV